MINDPAARAITMVGTRFRPQGRDPSTGLDCLGLVLAAHSVNAHLVPRDYRLRGDHFERMMREADGFFRKVRPGLARNGDVAVLEAGSDQLHLAILVTGGFVHADARIGRVVETPGASPWPVKAVLRRRRRNRAVPR